MHIQLIHMLFWTKERQAGVWDFRGKVGEKEQTFGKQIPARPSETMRHPGESKKQRLLGSSLVSHLVCLR